MKESQDASLDALKSANKPGPRSVVRELDVDDSGEGVELPGEFVHHRSQKVVVGGVEYCRECEG